ncbi:MAG: hypothetical protein JO034_00485 [Singulisphaera sp.]|nr:hypothetical protein [Singulisphaera sp.]
MRSARIKTLALGLVLGLALVPATRAALDLRQYYETTWTYSPTYSYYYVRYYYKPVVTYTTYEYHYCIYYPSQPSYIYYYNPATQVYWGRYEIGSKGDKRYSMLDPKDRKKDLKAIPEAAFPAPAAMPKIPGASDDVAMEPPPENVPKETK